MSTSNLKAPPKEQRGVESESRQILDLLRGLANRHLEQHPLSHLVGQRKTHLELHLRLPLIAPESELLEAIEHNEAVLKEELEALLSHRSIFQPGRVLCLRCSATDCEHSAPSDARQIFAGYGSTGLPKFADFGQWALERKHKRVDQLYSRPYRLITEVVGEEELNRDLLPAFRQNQKGYRIHGQVVAGWFEIPRPGQTFPLAVTFQVLSSTRRKNRRRFGLNVLASGPQGESWRQLYEELEDPPWASTVAWAQSVLSSIERSQVRRKGKRGGKGSGVDGRLEGLLGGIARRLEQRRRSKDRRTHHAEKRHASGDRPTRMALSDLARADDSSILADVRRKTLIVLGDRGRAHVFSPAGKLVTSIRYSPDSIQRKKQQEIWRPAKADQIMALRKKLGVEVEEDEIA